MAFPTVVNTNTTNGQSPGTSHSINLPASLVSGNLLVVVVMGTGSITPTPTGWTQFGGVHAVLTKTSDGTEGATLTVDMGSSARIAAVSYQIQNWNAVQVSYNVTNDDPPSFTPTFGSGDTLWIATMGAKRSDWEATAAPTNYTNLLTIGNISSSSTARCEVASARRELAAASENPGTFTISGTTDSPESTTIAIQAVGGAAATSLPPASRSSRIAHLLKR